MFPLFYIEKNMPFKFTKTTNATMPGFHISGTSALANPFRKESNQEEALRKYRDWLLMQADQPTSDIAQILSDMIRQGEAGELIRLIKDAEDIHEGVIKEVVLDIATRESIPLPPESARPLTEPEINVEAYMNIDPDDFAPRGDYDHSEDIHLDLDIQHIATDQKPPRGVHQRRAKLATCLNDGTPFDDYHENEVDRHLGEKSYRYAQTCAMLIKDEHRRAAALAKVDAATPQAMKDEYEEIHRLQREAEAERRRRKETSNQDPFKRRGGKRK